MNEPGFVITLSGIQATVGILASTGAVITAIALGVKAVCRANERAIERTVEKIGTRLLDEHAKRFHKETAV